MKQAQFFYDDPMAPIPNKHNLIGATTLIEYNNMLLLEHRMDSERWAIIGGSLHVNESLAECAVREIKEETGIVVNEKMISLYNVYDDPSIIISYPDGNVFRSIMFVYRLVLSGEPVLKCSEESKELRFFTKEEIRNVKIVETHLPILKDYLNEK